MPSLEIKTNVKLDDPKKFVAEFSAFAAETLGKPLQYICVTYTYNEYMAWNATFDPCFLLAIVSLDNINADANEKYSKVLFEHVEQKLNIPDHRGYISFTDPGRENLGHKRTTFGSIFGKK
ncbi:tautomerase/MIF [Phanerochaete sordida]|uniref:L-dopachrome isomerase n=1 Tax=Phanerochaete sordida TaxID=48140 RepID=A0A9P3LAJ2_9APHY|nr:tautomerase/MIF [Phanerochaete sordida]